VTAAPDSAHALVRRALGDRRALAALSGWALVGALPTFVSGQAIARAVDDGFLAGRVPVGLVWLGVLAASVPLGAWGARRTYLGVGRLAEPLRDGLVRAVVTRAVHGAAAAGNPDTGAVARLTQHVEAVRDTVAGLLLIVLGFVAALVAALAGLVTLAPVVLPLVLCPLAVSFAAFGASLRTVTRQQRRLLVADERLSELAGHAVGGLRDVVACGGEDTTAAALDERIDEQVDAGRALARVAALRTVIVAVGARVPVVLVLFGAGWLLDRGLSPGALLGTLTYLIQGLGPAVASLVSGVGTPLAQLVVTVRRIDDAGAPGEPEPAGEPDAAGEPGPERRPWDADLRLRSVTFRYRDDAEPVVDGLDLDVPDGDHLAIVGPSGAGKSTLAALVVGVLRPGAGLVTQGGWVAHEVAADRRVLIPQQAYAFRASLGDNLRYLRPDATGGELDRSVEAVGAAELVGRLGGYGAELDPGALSAGERQLVALVRAHLSPARLVVLDEATCHLDPTAEAVAERAFAARPGTVLVVAHRISSALRARRVLVMDGRRALLGGHDELVERSPLYRDLVGHWLDPTERLAG
jgi:ATP-binding cassette subfamily C protein